MASHIEGPIVDSLYDMALISWSNKLEPPLPAINTPAAVGGIHTFKDSFHDKLFGPNGILRGTEAILHPQNLPKRQPYGSESSGDLHTGPTSIKDATHPVEGGGQGNLTPKNEKLRPSKIHDKFRILQEMRAVAEISQLVRQNYILL